MMQVRSMRAKDIPEIHAIEKMCFPEPWSLISFYIFYMHPDLHCWTAKINGGISGYICFEHNGGALHIQNLAVRESQRNKGIAQRLLDQLLRYAQMHLLTSLRLEVSANNPAALALYGKNRFVQSGIIKAYYEHDKSDALILVKTLEKQ